MDEGEEVKGAPERQPGEKATNSEVVTPRKSPVKRKSSSRFVSQISNISEKLSREPNFRVSGVGDVEHLKVPDRRASANNGMLSDITSDSFRSSFDSSNSSSFQSSVRHSSRHSSEVAIKMATARKTLKNSDFCSSDSEEQPPAIDRARKSGAEGDEKRDSTPSVLDLNTGLA